MTKEKKYGKGDASWFVDARFGLFIHWGIYSLPARHEWVKSLERIPDEEYQRYFDRFNPDLYDPKEWAREAKNAGMKYLVVTSKHHDGFCLWDSAHTDYKSTETPYGKDLLKPMVQAFRDEGFRIGFYYSLVDWHHPEFTLDRFHPQGNDRKAIARSKDRDIKKYSRYLHKQVKELVTQFGEIDILWFDFSYPEEKNGKGRNEWQSEKLVREVRKLHPGVLLDDRLDLPGSADLRTAEQNIPTLCPVDEQNNPAVWEGCYTMGDAWGYHGNDHDWKDVRTLVTLLVEHVSRGGNLLLNVGPTGRGEFEPRAVDRLRGMGKWMRQHSRAIYGCTQAPEDLPAPHDCRYTYNPKTNRLYVHFIGWPYQKTYLPKLGKRVEYAQFLHDASEVKFWEVGPNKEQPDVPEYYQGALGLAVPVQRPDVEVPVVEVFLK